jgi:hypothetical protein
MSRSFLFLLGLAVVLGVGLGGAFIIGMVFGKSQGDATASVQGVTTFGPGGPPLPDLQQVTSRAGSSSAPGQRAAVFKTILRPVRRYRVSEAARVVGMEQRQGAAL